MKKDKNVTKVKTIDQFEFQIIPASISFSRKQSSKFYLYVQKGAQVLGKVNQLISGQQVIHKFMDSHNKRFRIANDKNLTYQWSIYRYTSDEEEEYMQSSSFNIKNHYQAYVEQIQKIQTYLYRIYGEKDKKCEIEQIWKDLRYDLTKNHFLMQCTFPKLNAKVNFRMRIRCELDFRYEKWKEEREKKRLAKSVNSTRKISIDSRNVSSEPASFLQVKEKYFQKQSSTSAQQLFIKPVLIKEPEVSNDKKTQQQQEGIRESQIRITDPQGVDVTAQSPQKSMKPTHDDDYYYRKKSSMLSDIIEESYEGSSNVFTKSNQGEKLKSVDEILEEEETLFSPLIKTQAYDSHKDQDYSDAIKRTATLFQKTSQQFGLQQTPKASIKKSSQYFPNVQHRNQQSTTQQKIDPFLLQSRRTISRKSSQSNEWQSQVVSDLNEAKKQTIKNVIMIIIIVVLLIVVINSLSLFDDNNKKSNYEKRKQSKNQHKIEHIASNKEKTLKHKN